MNYAPILISVYDRQKHLKQCIDSLLKNEISKKSDLYIVSDAPTSAETKTKIEAVREYISNVSGFNAIIPLFREKNLGSFLSINSAIDFVIKKHGKVIFLEDDNVVSENFLKFINDGLNFYQKDSSIFSISGYHFPVEIPAVYKFDIYKWQGFTAWGVGLWQNKWNEIDWSHEGIKEFLSDRHQIKAANRIAEHVVYGIRTRLNNNKPLTTDEIISVHLVKKKIYSIFPVVSKVRNVGLDGTGEHCGTSDIYIQQIIDTNSEYIFVENIKNNTKIDATIRKHFKYKLFNRIVIKLSTVKFIKQLKDYTLRVCKYKQSVEQ